jgi:hypothetical protein
MSNRTDIHAILLWPESSELKRAHLVSIVIEIQAIGSDADDQDEQCDWLFEPGCLVPRETFPHLLAP